MTEDERNKITVEAAAIYASLVAKAQECVVHDHLQLRNGLRVSFVSIEHSPDSGTSVNFKFNDEIHSIELDDIRDPKAMTKIIDTLSRLIAEVVFKGASLHNRNGDAFF